MNLQKKKWFRRFAVMVIVSMATFGLSGAHMVLAASVTSLSDNLSRLKASTVADHEIKFVTPTGVDQSSDTITLTFGAAFTMGSFAVANVDLAGGNSSNCTSATFSEKTLAASPTTGTWGVAQSGQVITLTAPTNATTGELTAGNCIRIRIGGNAVTGGTGTSQITNGSAAATTATVTIGGTFGDSGSLFVPIISDDQVNITATVDPTITFSINDNTIGFGTLSASVATYATGNTSGSTTEVSAHNLVAGTNAPSGYTLYVKGDTLTAGSNTITAIGSSAASSTPGTEQFGIRITTSGGIGSVISPYGFPTSYAYGATSSSQVSIAQATAASSSTTYSMYYVANIAAQTESGSYSTTLTYTAAGSF